MRTPTIGDILGLAGALGLFVPVVFVIRQTVRERVGRLLAVPERFWLLPAFFIAYCLAFQALAAAVAPESVPRADRIAGWDPAGIVTVYFLLPALVVYLRGRREGRADAADFLVVILLWLPVEYRWMLKGVRIGGVGYPVAALCALLYALLMFTSWRKLDLHCDWRLSRSDLKTVGLTFLVLAAVILPPAFAIDFVHPGLSAGFRENPWRLPAAPLILAVMFFFPAFVEELVFRGLIQNLLATRLRWLPALLVASAVFGFAHINNRVENAVAQFGPPNWTYVGFATIAGLGYGYVYHRTQSLVASSLLHALVDWTWLMGLKGD